MTRRALTAVALLAASCTPQPATRVQTTDTTTTPRHSAPPEVTDNAIADEYAAWRTTSTTTTVRVSRTTAQGRNLPTAPPAPAASLIPPAGAAQASWYARGTRTANGEAFNPDGHTFAHRTMPFGTVVRFCHEGRCVDARANDCGPATWTGRDFDLSRGAFAAIASLSRGEITVEWEAL